MTDFAAEYAKRLTTADQAAALIGNGTRMAMGLGISQPPALLKALADRAEAGQVSDVNIYYLLSMKQAGETVLRYELTDRLRPYSLFHGGIERKLEQQSRDAGRNGVWFIPSSFQQAPDVMVNQVKVDTLVTTVSPMDDEGYFSFGVNADYATPVARSGARLILEVNDQFPRVGGDTRVHISEVTAIVENNVPRGHRRNHRRYDRGWLDASDGHRGPAGCGVCRLVRSQGSGRSYRTDDARPDRLDAGRCDQQQPQEHP